MRKIFINFLFIFLFFPLFSQEKGYKITIELTDVDVDMLYVIGYYGHRIYIFDSLKVRPKHIYILQSKKGFISDGIYALVNKEKYSYMEFIVSQNRYFSIKSGQYKWIDHTVTGSDENIFFAKVKRMHYYNDWDNHEIIRQYTELSPESLLSKYLKAQYLSGGLPADYYDDNGKIIDVDAAYCYVINHFFDHIDFQDARLLRTPIETQLDFFFTEMLEEQPSDTINSKIDKLIAKMEGNDEVKHYYLEHLYKLFDIGLPENDGIIVHLYNTYCPDGKCDWLDDNFNRRIKRDALRKERTLPGKIVPPLEAYTCTEEKISTENLKNKYIIFWFWDPDCEHCLEETPILYEFYENFHDIYDFEVMAISITEDRDRWIKLISQFPHWINVSYAVNEPNYDFVDYFDLITTPGIFIIDKEHKIIARQFPLKNSLMIFESLLSGTKKN